MLVYGDHARAVEVRPELARIEQVWRELPSSTQIGVDRHGRLAAVFIGLSELLQGVGDEAVEAEPAFLALTAAAAAALRCSWDSGFLYVDPPPADLFHAAADAAPKRVTIKTAEGYAFYALYPEAYREAARELAPETRVIGVRSIGAGLACVVADAAGAPPPLTVRPTGHPFRREVALPPVDPTATYAVVDEGPGLSGSSFGAVADALEVQGVPAERILFLPGHDGDLGPQGSEAHRRRWRAARRPHVTFDDLIAPRLPGWVEDLTGPALSVEDFSGGAWRRLTHGGDESAWPPSAAHGERRKFLLRSEQGAFLLKFVGLGMGGVTSFERALTLHAAGWAPEPLGWRHGFLVERWVESRPLTAEDRPTLVNALHRYLAFRSEAFPAPDDAGAAPEALAEMARVNIAEALGPDLAARLPEPPPFEPRVAGDNRLHAWEWRVAPDGRVLKADALDHAFTHDLIGCQPPDWDRAGAVVEHDLSPEEAAAVSEIHPFWVTAYAAFQLGLWSMAADALGGWPEEQARCALQRDRYADRLRRALGTGL